MNMYKPNSMAAGLIGLLTVPPTVFLSRGHLYVALACQLLALAAYFRLPIIRRYREHIQGFAPYVITMNIFGLLVGLTAYQNPSWSPGIGIFWMIVYIIGGYTVAGKIERYNASMK
jgi:hypothetical protein